MSIVGNSVDLTVRLEKPEHFDELIRKLKLAKLMITPVEGPFDTGNGDDEPDVFK